jgi:O-antigen ligase
MVNVWNNPFLGIGLNAWERPYWLAGSMDNFWLLIAVRYGIPGFLLIAMAYLSLVWKVVRKNLGESGQSWQFRRGWAFMQIAMILTLCTVDVWDTPLSYVFFMLGAGAWLTAAQPEGDGSAIVVAPSHENVRNRYSRFSHIRQREVRE